MLNYSNSLTLTVAPLNVTEYRSSLKLSLDSIWHGSGNCLTHRYNVGEVNVSLATATGQGLSAAPAEKTMTVR